MIEGVAGVTVIDTSAGEFTVRLVEPLIPPDDAEIVVPPGATEFASPAAFTVAVPVVEEVHVTEPVRFCVAPLLYVPVAVNCCDWPNMIAGLAGATAIETRFAAATVRTVDPLTTS